jgi:hypothetical protein
MKTGKWLNAVMPIVSIGGIAGVMFVGCGGLVAYMGVISPHEPLVLFLVGFICGSVAASAGLFTDC